MNARLSIEEQRDIDIAEKTAEHVIAIRAKVAAGEPPTALIADGVFDLLCDSHLSQQLARLSLVVPAAVGMVHAWLAEHVIADQAEVKAIKEVEREEASVSSKDSRRRQQERIRVEISAAYTGYFPP